MELKEIREGMTVVVEGVAEKVISYAGLSIMIKHMIAEERIVTGIIVATAGEPLVCFGSKTVPLSEVYKLENKVFVEEHAKIINRKLVAEFQNFLKSSTII